MNIMQVYEAASAFITKYILMKNNLIALSFIVIFSPQFIAAQTVVKAKVGNAKAYMRGVATSSRNRRVDYRKYQDDTEVKAESGDISASEPNTQLKKDYNFTATRRDVRVGPAPAFNRLADASNLHGKDPMVAVGENYVLAADMGAITFFDKRSGEKIAFGNPAVNTLGAADFFAVFLSKTLPSDSGNVTNPNYIDDTYNIPDDIPAYCSRDTDNLTNSTDGIINEAYDVRVAYEKTHKRYVILAALRNQCTRTNDLAITNAMKQECRSYCVRLVAWGVSVTEDPRDGFIYYRTGENNYRDWPRFTVDKDYLTIANNGPGDDGSSMITVYSFPAMAAGSGTVGILAIQRIDALGTPRSVIPIQNYHTISSASPYLYFAEKINSNKGLRFWYIKKPDARQDLFRTLPQAKLEPAGQISFGSSRFNDPLSGIVFSNNSFWIVTNSVAHAPTGSKLKAYGLNVFKVPVKSNGSQRTVSAFVPDGFKHYFYEHADYSFEMPAIVVNSFNDIVLSFIRYPVTINTSERSQIRYKVFFHDETDARGSVVAKESAVASNEKLDLDYSWSAWDPYDSFTFWIANSFRNSSNDRSRNRSMHVHKVNISSLK